MMTSELIWGVVGLALTIMVLSYLIGDNFLFRLAVHIFIGVTAGFLSVLIIRQILWPYLLAPLISGSGVEMLWVLIPLGLAILLLMSQFTRFVGVGRIPLAFLAGLTAAIAIGGAMFGTMIPQIRTIVDSFDPVGWYQTPGYPWLRIFESVVMLIGVVGTLSYFHFGRRQLDDHEMQAKVRPWIFEVLGKVGEVFIGIALGAVFAGIFSTALLALIDRLIFVGQFVSRLMGGG